MQMQRGLGSFASLDVDISLRNCCESFVGNCRELRRLSSFKVEGPTRIAEISGDDESAQKLRGKISESWLAKFPSSKSRGVYIYIYIYIYVYIYILCIYIYIYIYCVYIYIYIYMRVYERNSLMQKRAGLRGRISYNSINLP